MRTRERGRPRGPIAAQRRRCLSTHALAASWQRSQPHAQWCRRVELESLQCELRLVRGQCKAAEAKNEALEQRERSRQRTAQTAAGVRRQGVGKLGQGEEAARAAS